MFCLNFKKVSNVVFKIDLRKTGIGSSVKTRAPKIKKWATQKYFLKHQNESASSLSKDYQTLNGSHKVDWNLAHSMLFLCHLCGFEFTQLKACGMGTFRGLFNNINPVLVFHLGLASHVNISTGWCTARVIWQF